jgi:hypothetical protein
MLQLIKFYIHYKLIDFFIAPKNHTFAEQITILTKVLYEQRGNIIELDPTNFQQIIENADSRLQGFFDQLVKALIPNNRSEYNKIESKKTTKFMLYYNKNKIIITYQS